MMYVGLRSGTGFVSTDSEFPYLLLPTSVMRIPTKAVWLAIYRIFSDQQISAGCSLTLKELMTAWSGSGLRVRDLAEGLETLAHSGFMSLELGSDGPCARLLDAQFGLLDPSGKDRGTVTALERLRESRQRPAHLTHLIPHGDGRRAEDRYFAAQAA